MKKYVVRRTNQVCPEDWYAGGCPLTGVFIRVQIGQLSQDQLKAWLTNSHQSAGKYVKVEEVPKLREKQPKRRRKSTKKIVNAKAEAESTEETKAS